MFTSNRQIKLYTSKATDLIQLLKCFLFPFFFLFSFRFFFFFFFACDHKSSNLSGPPWKFTNSGGPRYFPKHYIIQLKGNNRQVAAIPPIPANHPDSLSFSPLPFYLLLLILPFS